jgi:uncharacterized protein YndB with AHSA1/START domain
MDELGELRHDGDYRSVRFERRYAAGPEAVWAALTDPAQLRRWLAEAVTFENEAGGSVALRFGDEPEQVVQGSILVYEPPRLLEYEWHWRGQTSSSVRFELTADSDGTLLVLDHRGLPRDAATGYAAGWHAYLDRLGAEFGGNAATWDERFADLLPRYRELAGQAPRSTAADP